MDKKKESPLIIKFNNFYQDVNGVTFFKIAVKDKETNKDWEFDERYSVMRDIHKALRDQYKGELPDFPTKKWFGNTDKNFLSQRKATLQTYFINILNHLDIQKYPILKNFFYRNANNNGGNSPVKINQPEIKKPEGNGPTGHQAQQNPQEKKNQKAEQITEKQLQENRAKEFAQQMIKINEKVQNKFIANLTDYVSHQDEGMHEQKKSLINKNQFNLKSNLLTSLSLPGKSIEKPDLNLKENINLSKITSGMDSLASKLLLIYDQNMKSYNKLSSQIIVGREYD